MPATERQLMIPNADWGVDYVFDKYLVENPGDWHVNFKLEPDAEPVFRLPIAYEQETRIAASLGIIAARIGIIPSDEFVELADEHADQSYHHTDLNKLAFMANAVRIWMHDPPRDRFDTVFQTYQGDIRFAHGEGEGHFEVTRSVGTAFEKTILVSGSRILGLAEVVTATDDRIGEGYFMIPAAFFFGMKDLAGIVTEASDDHD